MPWVERDTGVTLDNDLQGGWDPWWFTPQKQGTSNPDYAILFRCQTGAIYRSVNCGQSWLNVTPLTDPPDTWSQTPAPTATTVDYIQRVDNIHINGWHCFLTRFQDGGGNWGSWLLLTEDDGVTWTWQPLYNYLSGGNLINNGHFTGSCAGWAICDAHGVEWEAGRVKFSFRALSNTYTSQICTFANATYQVTAKFEDRNPLYTQEAALTIDGDWVLSWPDPEVGIKTATWTEVVGNWTVLLRCPFQTGTGGLYGYWDNVSIYLVEQALQSYVIWADVDSEDGSTLYLTIWIDGNLCLQIVDTATMTIVDACPLGAATIGEVTAKTYIAYPMTPFGYGSHCFVHGRMNAPAGLAGVQHIIRTGNKGDSWLSVESGWGADRCCALQVGTLRDDGARPYYAIRSGNAGAPAQFHYGLNGLALAGNLPFGNNVSVYVDAMSIAGNGNIVAGADTAGSIMIAESEDNGATWIDITDNYPIIGTVSSLTYL